MLAEGSSMRRSLIVAVAVFVSSELSLGRGYAQHHVAPAQPMPTPGFYNGFTPNSTIDGDAARMAAYTNMVNAEAARLGALGTFNLNRAHADAIDSATLMSWNEYFAACLAEENRRSGSARASRRKHLIEMYHARKARIANNPEEIDLLNGDALNELLAQLSNPKIHPSSIRKHGETIPGETIQRCAFRYPSLGLTISLGRLTIRDGWPLSLREKAFAPDQATYRKAVEAALEENLQGKLTAEAFRTLQQAVVALKSGLKEAIHAAQKEDYVSAKAYLDDLGEAVATLRDPNAEKVLAGVDRYGGTTVGDAVTFMQRYNLRFAPALTADERESYHLLYASMLQLRDVVAPADATVPGTNGKVPIVRAIDAANNPPAAALDPNDPPVLEPKDPPAVKPKKDPSLIEPKDPRELAPK
jgi:hypothetical protein